MKIELSHKTLYMSPIRRITQNKKISIFLDDGPETKTILKNMLLSLSYNLDL